MLYKPLHFFFLSCYAPLKLTFTDVPGHDELGIISSGPLDSVAPFLLTDKKDGTKINRKKITAECLHKALRYLLIFK